MENNVPPWEKPDVACIVNVLGCKITDITSTSVVVMQTSGGNNDDASVQG